MTRPPIVREAIVAALKEHGTLNGKQICNFVCAKTGSTPSGIRKVLWFMEHDGFIACDKSRPRRHLYSLSDDEPVRRTVRQASDFKLPTKLKRADALSPMAWSMAYLLGAA
ncbi:hypothetical protein [Herbaspirillum sp. RV1423]|uniref:hypothetical protein n=1 Tax=Herbaspirillum sp. RV1423 TaxID=1443993 RepID=UPI0005579491|nr:hypothetical protein [Herbaspirillum sp. RV1423]